MKKSGRTRSDRARAVRICDKESERAEEKERGDNQGGKGTVGPGERGGYKEEVEEPGESLQRHL